MGSKLHVHNIVVETQHISQLLRTSDEKWSRDPVVVELVIIIYEVKLSNNNLYAFEWFESEYDWTV